MEQRQEYWKTIPASYFFLAAMGAMMFVISAVSDLMANQVALKINGWVSIIALVIAGCGSLLLLAELTHRSRAHLVNARPFSSVMSFGSVIQTLYMALVFIYATFFFSFIPWSGMIMIKNGVAVLTIIVALLYVAYPGVELGEAKGRAFWNGGGLVSLFLISGMTTGSAALILLLMLFGYADTAYTNMIKLFSTAMLLLQLVAMVGYVFGMKVSANEEARRGANILWCGELKTSFWWGIIFFGTILPLLGNLFMGSIYWLVMSSILVLVGGVYFRIDFLLAAVRIVLPGEEHGEMSRKEIKEFAAMLENRWQEKAVCLGAMKEK